MLSKAKQEREKRLAEMKRMSKAKAQVQKAAREKNEKEKRIQEQLSQWCLKKRMDNDLKKLKVSCVCSCCSFCSFARTDTISPLYREARRATSA